MDGVFHFPLIPEGSYRMDVDESFLYNFTSITDLEVQKGMTLDVGDIQLGPKSMGSLKVQVNSSGVPLEGAWVRIVDDMIRDDSFNLTTNSTGVAFYPKVLAGAVTLEAGAEHHNIRGDMAFVPVGREGLIEFNLVEDQLPVWIEPVETDTGGNVLAGSDLLVHVPEPITFSTLNITMWRTDPDNNRIEEIPLTPPEKGVDDLTYIIDPMISLPLESSYVLIVSDELMTLVSPTRVIWRNLEYEFSTPDLPLIHINGTLLFEGEVMEDFEVRFHQFAAFTDDTGNFNITVDPVIYDVNGELIVNGSIYGYGIFEEDLSLTAGMQYEVGTINLFHVPGWYSVSPSDGSENVDPDTVIVFTFMRSLMVPEPDKMNRFLSLIPEGQSAPIAGDYLVSDENRTVTFTPANELEPNTLYQVKISRDLKGWDNVSMFPLGNRTTFTTKPPAISISIIEPSTADPLPLDGTIRLGFSYNVDKTAVENALSFDPSVGSVMIDWVSGSEIRITGNLRAEEDYTLSLPSGIYGLDNEPVLTDFIFDFTTGAGYGRDHLIGTPQIFPDPEEGWEPGETIRLSGNVDDSPGFIVTLVLSKGDEQILDRTEAIDMNGGWNINITSPLEEGSYKLVLTVSMPEGPVADEIEYDVDVGEASSSTPASNGSTIMIVIIIIIVVLIVIVAAVIYAMNQRKKADDELSSVEYTELKEDDWEDDEE
jgi:hypothetical protein